MSARAPSRRPAKGQARITNSHTNVAPNSPSVESRLQGGSSIPVRSRAARGAGTSAPVDPSRGRPTRQQQQAPPPQPSNGVLGSPIDVEAIDDDDVEMLSSSTGFPQARNQSRRNHPVTVVLDEDVEVHPGPSGVPTEEPVILLSLNTRNKRERIPSNRTIINCESYLNSEDNNDPKRKNVVKPPPEPTFTCPICMNPLVEASSTICGHIFCQSCIKAAIQAHKKCPICTRKLTMSNLHRVYLPSAE